MKGIGQNFNIAQRNHTAAVRADMAKIDAKEASHAAQTGASGQIAKKAKDAKTKAPGETLDPQLMAKLQKANEKDAAQDAKAEAKKSLADDAVAQNKSTKRKDLEQDNDDYRIGQGDVQKKDGSRVLSLDGADGDETFEISKTQAKQLDGVDGRTPEQILHGMPESNRKAAEATLDTQIKTQGKEKVANLKDNPKVTEIAEKMDLEPAESLKESATVAPIRTPADEPPKMVEDPHAEAMAKKAAQKQMMEGGGEAMMAS